MIPPLEGHTMARVHTVKRSNKSHVCAVGGHEIPKGDPYLWAKPGFRTRTPLVRCMNHPFRPSDLATGLNAEPMRAQEDFDATIASLEEHDYEGLNAAVSEFRDALEAYRDVRQEALDAWENGNSQFEEWAEEAEGFVSTFESLDEASEYEEEEPTEPSRDDFDTEDAYDEAVTEYETAHADWEEARAQHWEDAVSAADDASGEVAL